MEASQPQTTDELLRAVLAEQQQHRAEVASLREELAASKPAPVVVPAQNLSAEDAAAARLAEIGQHSHYCPGCGLLYDYQQRCTGRAESGHPPIEVLSTDELKSGDQSQHSAPVYVNAR
jgi:NADH pyrophosphatase NudC (nudix superfamily)